MMFRLSLNMSTGTSHECQVSLIADVRLISTHIISISVQFSFSGVVFSRLATMKCGSLPSMQPPSHRSHTMTPSQSIDSDLYRGKLTPDGPSGASRPDKPLHLREELILRGENAQKRPILTGVSTSSAQEQLMSVHLNEAF